jgi:histidine triad (HIT) family protein
MVDGCLFCKIVKGELDAVKIWEDDEFISILDMFPDTKGKALVITKKHYDSDLFELPEDLYKRMLLAARTVAKHLKKGLNAKRIVVVVEGLEVNHVHIKLIPFYGKALSFRLGPKVENAELEKIAEEIKHNRL